MLFYVYALDQSNGAAIAGMHEERDRAILAVQRLAEAEGAVKHHVGFNPRKVKWFHRLS